MYYKKKGVKMRVKEKQSVLKAVRLTENLAEKISAYGKLENMDDSEVIRAALKYFFKNKLIREV
jgi:hypothetical protein